jgi:hypothetical protein
MIRFYLLIITLGLCSLATAQEKSLYGKVFNKDSIGISGATIIIYELENKHSLGYAIADTNGNYQISFTTKETRAMVEVSMLGYASHIDTLTIAENNIAHSVQLLEKVAELETVVVKAVNVGDTMHIPTDKMVLNERSTLKDILNQTDGFMISEDGSISFRGKQIKKILINKKEVFVRQNKVALDNLNYGIMDNLQLINNYKDKFNIDFNNFKESVININTKKEFKGVLKITGEAAGGYENKYQAKLRNFYFSDVLNSFLTSNINNIGEKDFSFKDMPASFSEQSSEWFRNNTSLYFQENEFAKTAFDWDNSFTIRKEGSRYRMGTIIYYTRAKQKMETELITLAALNNNSKVKEEEAYNINYGNMLAANTQFSYLLGKKTALNFMGTAGYSNSKEKVLTDIHNYLPSSTFIQEYKWEKPETFLGDGELNIKTLFAQSLRFTSGIKYTYEHSNSELYVAFNQSTNSSDTLWQSYSFQIHHVQPYTELEKKFNGLLTIGLGISIQYFNETLYTFFNNKHRKGHFWEPHLTIRGQKSKWEYEAKLKPQYYNFYISGNKHNKNRPEVSAYVHYKLNGNNDAWLNYSQHNTMPDLVNDIDTLLISFNQRLISNQPVYNTVSSNTNWQAGYYYSNLTRLQNVSVSYSFGRNDNYLESVFETIQNNVFFYKNLLVDKRNWQQFNTNAGKGFYFSPSYHKIYFTVGVDIEKNSFQTIVNSSAADFTTKSFQYSGSIRLEPQNWYLSQIMFNAKLENAKLFLEKENINTQKNVRFTGEVSRKQDKFDFALTAGYTVFKNKETDFSQPILNFKTTVQLSNVWQLYVKGQNLFHLFNIAGTSFTGLDIQSEGNFVNQSINRYNMNFLIAGFIYKP